MQVRLIIAYLLILISGAAYSQCNQDTLSIGTDTILCTGQSIVLDAGPGYLDYTWNGGSTNANITVNSSGQYSCAARVMDPYNLVPNGDFTFGNIMFTSNYIYGTGGTWGLLSSEGQYAISTNSNLTHNNFANCPDHTTGTGNFMIVNGAAIANQHVWAQTIIVQPNTQYIFSAWFTSVVSSNPATLDFTINGVAIGPSVTLSSTTGLWQNFYQTWTSGPTQTTANIAITNMNTGAAGNDFGIDDIYFAQICEYHDTVDVTVYDYPSFTLGNDTSICKGDSVTYNIVCDSVSTYIWHDSSTANNFNAIQTDTIWLEVSNAHCKKSDTVVVTVNPYPQIDLGNDTTICGGDSLLLDVQWGNATYLWQNGSTTPSQTATTTGTYWVELSNHDCISSDTINLTISNGPSPNMGPDQYFCMGDSVILNPGIWNSYLWNNGNTSNEISVSPVTQEEYSVIVWDQDGCSDSTSIIVNPIPYPTPLIIASEDTLCLGRTLILEATGGDQYIWNTGMPGNSMQLIPNADQLYTVTVSNIQNGVSCSADTSVYIVIEDCNTLFVPNAFTPDGDGLNDQFGPMGEFDLEHFEMHIYNRWGQVVFKTDDIFTQWDGNDINGSPYPLGVYSWIIVVREPMRETQMMRGTVTLIR